MSQVEDSQLETLGYQLLELLDQYQSTPSCEAVVNMISCILLLCRLNDENSVQALLADRLTTVTDLQIRRHQLQNTKN